MKLISQEARTVVRVGNSSYGDLGSLSECVKAAREQVALFGSPVAVQAIGGMTVVVYKGGLRKA